MKDVETKNNYLLNERERLVSKPFQRFSMVEFANKLHADMFGNVHTEVRDDNKPSR